MEQISYSFWTWPFTVLIISSVPSSRPLAFNISFFLFNRYPYFCSSYLPECLSFPLAILSSYSSSTFLIFPFLFSCFSPSFPISLHDYALSLFPFHFRSFHSLSCSPHSFYHLISSSSLSFHFPLLSSLSPFPYNFPPPFSSSFFLLSPVFPIFSLFPITLKSLPYHRSSLHKYLNHNVVRGINVHTLYLSIMYIQYALFFPYPSLANTKPIP